MSSDGCHQRTGDARIDEEESHTIKAIYEDGVFKPRERVALADRTEVELDFRPYVPEEDEDIDNPMSFIGLIQNVPKGVPIAQDHDKYLPCWSSSTRASSSPSPHPAIPTTCGSGGSTTVDRKRLP